MAYHSLSLANHSIALTVLEDSLGIRRTFQESTCEISFFEFQAAGDQTEGL